MSGGSLEGRRCEAVVVGGGQAGISASVELRARGIDHLVLERRHAFWEWHHRRWDSFCLVTPNWQCRLPGHPYDGDDPDGFMVREEILRYLDAFLAASGAPLHTGVEVTGLRAAPGGGYVLDTSEGRLRAGQVVIASGPYGSPVVPALAGRLPADLTQVHSSEYRNPGSLPPGAVLVVGTGQSGCQIAEDLHLAGRKVHLATGSAPRVARRYRGKDVTRWLEDSGYYATTVAEHPQGEEKRRNVNHYVTGRDGGHDIDLRARALEGMVLHGRLTGVEGATLDFGDDLAANLDNADAVAERIKDTIDGWIGSQGIDAPAEARYRPVWQPPAGTSGLDLDQGNVSAVVWCTGFRQHYDWVEAPVFDAAGRPVHDVGVSPVEGLYFLGLPWLQTWGSARFSGVASDAAHVVDVLAARRARPQRRSA